MRKLRIYTIIILIFLLFIPCFPIGFSVDRHTVKTRNDFPEPIIEQPELGRVYWLNNRSSAYIYVFDVLNITIIFSRKFTVKVLHPESENVSKIEFYIDGSKQWENNEPPYEWMWDTIGFGILGRYHQIEVVAYNLTGVQSNTSIWAFKFP